MKNRFWYPTKQVKWPQAVNWPHQLAASGKTGRYDGDVNRQYILQGNSQKVNRSIAWNGQQYVLIAATRSCPALLSAGQWPCHAAKLNGSNYLPHSNNNQSATGVHELHAISSTNSKQCNQLHAAHACAVISVCIDNCPKLLCGGTSATLNTVINHQIRKKEAAVNCWTDVTEKSLSVEKKEKLFRDALLCSLIVNGYPARAQSVIDTGNFTHFN